MAGELVGALRVTLGVNTANYEAGMKRAARQTATAATSIQRSLASIKGGLIGAATGLLSVGTLGAIGALAKRSLDYAASLGEVAQQLGVTTESLQVFRYAATQVGLSTEEMDGLLAKLTRSIGEAGQGSKAQAEAFNELGVNVRTANGDLKDTDRVLREMADGFKKTKNPADQARLAVDLMGRAGQKAIPLLVGGAEGVDQLREAAHKLGVVLSDEQIQNADKTADKMEALKKVLEARIAGTVADNAGAIIELANALSEFVNWVLKGTSAWLNFTKTVGNGSLLQGLAQFIRNPAVASFEAGRRLASGQGVSGEVGVGQLGTSVTGNLGPIKPFQPPSAGGLNPVAGGKGGGRKGKSAEDIAEELRRKAKDEAQRQLDIARDLSNARADELDAQRELEDDYVDRAEISRALIDIETEIRNAQLAFAVKWDGMDKSVGEQLTASNERLRILKKQAIKQETDLQAQEDFERTEQTRFDIQMDRLRAESALAETAAERRRVEMEILDLAYRERKERLERIIAESRDAEARRRAQLELDALPGQRARDEAGVRQGTRGPLESYMASLPTTAEKMNEALQLVAADGLRALEDGILAVIDGTKSLGDAFRDMANQIISDLLRIQVQKMIAGLIGNIAGAAGGLPAPVASGTPIPGAFGAFAGGGFTGFMPRQRVAGIVHGQEYVFDADSTRRIGIGNLEALRRGMSPANNNVREGDNYNLSINIPPGMSPKQARESGSQLAAGFHARMAQAKRQGF